MHDALQTNLQLLVTSTQALQAAAPDHPWDDGDPKYAAMTDAWVKARNAYEEIEGATAPIFPDIDTSIDGRVEDFGPAPGTGTLDASCDMFSGQCMSGLHAIERVLYVKTTPASVVAYEQGLGYVPGQSFPTTQQAADEFKNQLCAKAASDAMKLMQGWQTPVIDINSAFDGLISLMNEQSEKVTKAGLNQEESRYSQRTMDDLRHNLTGTSNIYSLFQQWIRTKPDGTTIDGTIESGFQALDTLYNSPTYAGVALPQPPADWSDTMPSPADLMSDFGQLFVAVQTAVDPKRAGSVVSEMNAAAAACGIPQFTGE